MKCLSIFLFLGLILTIAVASPSKRAKELSNIYIDDIETELKGNARSADDEDDIETEKENAISVGASESNEDEDDNEEVLAQDEDGDDKIATLAHNYWFKRRIRCLVYTCRFGHNSFTCRRRRRCRRRGRWGRR